MENKIKELKEKVKQIENGIKFIEAYGEELESIGGHINTNVEAVEVTKLEDVAKVKNVLRKEFDHFEFRLSFYSRGTTISTWNSPDTDWEIWLRTPIEDFPAELKSDSCKWVKKTVVEDDYVLVCE